MVKIVLRIMEDENHEELVKLAKDSNRSLNNQINTIIQAWFDPAKLRARLAELERNPTAAP